MMRHIAPIAQTLRHIRNAPRPAMFHPHEEQDLTAGQHFAEVVAARLGSWGFIAAQALLMASWVVVNTIFLFASIRFDSYPFVFLNLAMSAEAAFTGPILLIAANAGAQRDHKQAERMAALLARIDTLLEEQQPREMPLAPVTPMRPRRKRAARGFDPMDPIEE